MWRNYLTVGVRALMKNRTYAAINILGLAIGMAACLLILLFVRYETGFDRMLPGAENAYQFQTYYRDRQTGEEGNLQMAAYVSKAALEKDFPQIEKAVYSMGVGPTALKDGQAYAIEDGQFVDGNLFDIVRLPFLIGNPATALSRPGQVVLSTAEATRFFGAPATAMGKTLTLVSRGKQMDFTVTGVLDGPTRQSHMKVTFVARIDMAAYNAEQPQFLTNWGWQSGWVYLRLKPGADVAQMNAQMPAFEKRNIRDEIAGTQRTNQGDESDYALVNIRDIHLGKAQDGAMTPGNDRRSIVTFAVIALLILGMACVNFTNLATARASQRAREVALRKVLGASRRQLIVQFLCEAMLIAAVAMVIALAVVELALPYVANFLQADLTLDYLGAGGALLPIVALVLVVGIAAGAYPAFFLSRFQPATVLKANKSASDAQGSGRLRNVLVIGQFAVSIALIICTAVIYAQTVFARTSDPGYQRDGLIQIEGIARRQTWPMIDTFINELQRTDGVVAVGRTGIGIATRNNTNNGVQIPGRSDPVTIGSYSVDTDFFRTMGIRLIAGRSFDRNRPADDSTTPFPQAPAAERALVARGMNVVINELAVKRLGFKSPQDAIGKQVLTTVDADFGGVMPTTIIGVVTDSRFRSIRDPLDPIAFRYESTGHGALLVRYRSADPAAVNTRIEGLWKRLFPDVPYDGRFSEDIVGKLYAADAARARIFAGFALLAIVIGCLGLFGLAAFTAERRTKEIGIRKVLGARTRDIVRLLVWQFSQPVILANLIAWPAAWWLMRGWLNGFDTRIALTPTPFLLAGALALLIAIGTISAHAWRVARTSPIRALRYE
jgi:putative ABC transport system permease protein